MPLSRLELVSSYGDQTLSRVRFVVHGTSNATDALSIMDAGLVFTEGRPTVSTNIVHAHDWTVNPGKQAQSWGGGTSVGEPGSVILCAVPANYYLGYGVFTSAYIDRQAKCVLGAPLRYAGARKQLAFYTQSDTEASRMHVESEVANGYALDQHPRMNLDTRYIIGSFPPDSGFDATIVQLDVAIRSMQPLEFERFERSFMDILHLPEPANSVLAATAIRDIIVGTIESTIVSRLRMMRWQGLKLLGYTFQEGETQVQIVPVSDLTEQRRRMDEMGRMIASSALFGAELSWLKVYVSHQLEAMRFEIEAAELESMPD
jgi:hypothetical protein